MARTTIFGIQAPEVDWWNDFNPISSSPRDPHDRDDRDEGWFSAQDRYGHTDYGSAVDSWGKRQKRAKQIARVKSGAKAAASLTRVGVRQYPLAAIIATAIVVGYVGYKMGQS